MLSNSRQQAWIHDFFPSDRIPRRSLRFFDLPVAIRKRIYKYACYEHEPWAYESTLFSLKGRGDPITRPYTRSDELGGSKIAAALLLSCHDIHDEMFEIIYAENDFNVQQGVSGGFDVLYRLKPSNVAALTCLTVPLDINRPATTSLCRSPSRQSSCSRHAQTGTTPQEINLQEWHDVLRHILPNLKQKSFAINLICELRSLPLQRARQMAQRLSAPLDGTLTLRNCSIELGAAPDMELRSLAEEVATKAMGIQQAGRQFRLLDLPPELRLQILSYTDLVTEHKQVEWRPSLGYWTPGKRSCVNFEDNDRSNFCRRAHAAYSRGCRCWISPLPIFLTCRTLRFEAERIFFQHNRIIITPINGTNNRVDSTPSTLEISRYLRTVIPAHAIGYLRCLEIVFPPFEGGFLQESEPAYRDWLSVLDSVKDSLNCPQLVLRVCFAAWAPGHTSYRPMGSPDPTDDRAEEIFDTYRRVLSPLSVLRARGFHHLFLDLTSPFWYHLGQLGAQERDMRWKAWAASVKAEIENGVLGEHYSGARFAQTESLWKLKWNDMVYRDGCEVVYDGPLLERVSI